jgi:predicted O-methyltransferase YrrM
MRSLIKRCVPQAILEPYQMKKYGRFLWMKLQTDGLLGADLYEAIHRTFLDDAIGDHDIVEVGGASGSASIAIAWALKERRCKSKLVVVEKFEGGTRAQFGGYNENYQRFQEFIKRYGVADRIVLFADYLTMENSQQVVDLVSGDTIGGMMLDADGHIHRDFAIFWERLAPGAPIVIDDYHPNTSVKHELTYLLLNRFIEWQLVERRELIDDTFFGTKGSAESIAALDLEECERITKEVCGRHNVSFDRSGIVLTA